LIITKKKLGLSLYNNCIIRSECESELTTLLNLFGGIEPLNEINVFRWYEV